LLAGCLRDVHDVECQLLLFKTDAGNCFLRASSNSRTSAAVAEFPVSMICRIRGVLASQVAASLMKSIPTALRYNAGGGIWLFCWKSYLSWVSQRSAGDFPSYLPAVSNFGRRIAEGRVGKVELDMVVDCFGAWDCKSSGRRDKSLGSVKRVDGVGWKVSNSLIERSVRIFRRGAPRRLIKGLDLRRCRSCWVASSKGISQARHLPFPPSSSAFNLN
jgi:hypothetical protein